MPPTTTLTIYLLKDSYLDGSTALREGDLNSNDITGIGTLYTVASQKRPPKWLTFFDNNIPNNATLFNSTASGVLFVEAASRIFAVTFGYGKNLLIQGSWEEGFGLRVTLNSIAPDKIKSIDHKTFETVTRHSRTQTSREGSAEDFGLDVERDLVRAVTGQPIDTSLGKRLTGMDALVAVAKVDLQGLPALLERYHKQFLQQDYKTHFSWIDNISEVRDPGVIKELNSRLLKRFQSSADERLWLSVPDLVDWSVIGGFKYMRSEGTVHVDLSIKDFIMTLDDSSLLTLELLRKRRIFVMNRDEDKAIDDWPVFACIYCEEDIDNETFLLTGGKWYKVEKQFVANVNEFIEQLTSNHAPLPIFDSVHDGSEGKYNERVAAASNGAMAHMDEKSIYYGGGKSKFEFCDLYSDSKELLHVKRYGGSSAPLSHLFAQGSTSAQLWLMDRDFRKDVNALLPSSHKIKDPSKKPNPSEYTIVFAIITKSQKRIDKCLPFFSRLTLRDVAKRLDALGYQVSIRKIQQI